ncbi:single-stranded DNA-binding protein [Clostridium perfringens]|uniref:single-stranded DNA-binding protein n=1 Tax=Clostridium perfringens TaxID=1502 RepID=UPI0013E2F3ED|nr:single-stranded DNA-binding protein [Clostridium perfringens]NGT45400.1 single-stranded DNA-binding protein [Clostridium perfringens]
MNSILPQAVNLLSYINSGETFIIKDLFPKIIWDKLSYTEKITLESAFLKHINKKVDLRIKALNEIREGLKVYEKL